MTKLEICNRALTRCGVEPIASLIEQNKRAILVTAQYEATLKEILNDTPWNFAIGRVLIHKGATPLYGFNCAYDLPSDVIRVLEIDNPEVYRVEGRKLLSNYDADTLNIKAIMSIIDTTLFSPSFIKAFYLKLAEDISYALIQSAALQQAIISEAERYLRRARSYNSQEGTPDSRYPEEYTGSLRL